MQSVSAHHGDCTASVPRSCSAQLASPSLDSRCPLYCIHSLDNTLYSIVHCLLRERTDFTDGHGSQSSTRRITLGHGGATRSHGSQASATRNQRAIAINRQIDEQMVALCESTSIVQEELQLTNESLERIHLELRRVLRRLRNVNTNMCKAQLLILAWLFYSSIPHKRDGLANFVRWGSRAVNWRGAVNRLRSVLQ